MKILDIVNPPPSPTHMKMQQIKPNPQQTELQTAHRGFRYCKSKFQKTNKKTDKQHSRKKRKTERERKKRRDESLSRGKRLF